MEDTSLPWTNIPPGPNFVLIHPSTLPLSQVNGMQENVHTGGLTGSLYHPVGKPNEIWKPLDYGAHPLDIEKGNLRRWPTKEWEALSVLREANRFGAQRNIRRETGDGGRQWLVMPRYEECGWHEWYEDAYKLRETIWWFNANGWEIGDHLTVMLDPTDYEIVLVDMSCAWFSNSKQGIYKPDDRERWLAWMKAMKLNTKLSEKGRGKLSREWYLNPALGNKTKDDALDNPPRHIYVSLYRPFSLLWADKWDGDYSLVAHAWFEHEGPPHHTWIGTHKPLSQRYCEPYELTWAWSEIDYEGGS
jgi:hypothetical protein